MEIKFHKYEAQGNDFILIDGYNQEIILSNNQIKILCDRHFGTGADGLIIIKKRKGYDFEMLFHNPDATTGMMCGNGGRCALHFVYYLGIKPEKENYNFVVAGKNYFGNIDGFSKSYINLCIKSADIEKKNENEYFINTGTEHLIVFDDFEDEEAFRNYARQVRYSKEFEHCGGTNVSQVKILDMQHLEISTYERGVEDITLSCGTGKVAAALAYIMKINRDTKYETLLSVTSKGGYSEVSVTKYGEIFHCLYIGSVKKVFEVMIEI